MFDVQVTTLETNDKECNIQLDLSLCETKDLNKSYLLVMMPSARP